MIRLLAAPRAVLLLEPFCSFPEARNIELFLRAHHLTCSLDKKVISQVAETFRNVNRVFPTEIRPRVVKVAGTSDRFLPALTDCGTSKLWDYTPSKKDQITFHKLGWK